MKSNGKRNDVENWKVTLVGVVYIYMFVCGWDKKDTER